MNISSSVGFVFLLFYSNCFSSTTATMVERIQNPHLENITEVMPSTAATSRTKIRTPKPEIIDYSDEELSFEPPVLISSRIRRHAMCNEEVKHELGKRNRPSYRCREVDELTQALKSSRVRDTVPVVPSLVRSKKNRAMSEDSTTTEGDTTDGERTRRSSEKEQSDDSGINEAVQLLQIKRIRTTMP